MQQHQGNIKKLFSELQSPVQYALPIGDEKVNLNKLLGKKIQLTFDGVINCTACQRVTKKSFSQGHCFPCMRKLASCDQCIVRPELCHFAAGTCREPDWGLQHCMQPHVIYLANSSGLKVGITRQTQVPTRWIDQGAIQALPLLRVQSRLQSGIMEVYLKKYAGDKTNWRTMLSGKVEPLDLLEKRDAILQQCEADISAFHEQFSTTDIEILNDEAVINIEYPVSVYSDKVKSLNFDKTPTIAGELLGIKGQYLILDSGVLNLRKFTGYYLTMSVED